MAIIFDLDDTLYPEESFVRGGLAAVADHAKKVWGWPRGKSLNQLHELLLRNGRGSVFDDWLRANAHFSRSRVNECIQVYRQHKPSIALYSSAEKVLQSIPPEKSTFIVTDGNKLVQANKVNALRLWERVTRVFITHRYGRNAAKPSTYCFEKIQKIGGFAWEEMVYIGDDPRKDFVSLRPLGMQTVRVRTGTHKRVVVSSQMDAEFSVASLERVLDLNIRAFKQSAKV